MTQHSHQSQNDRQLKKLNDYSRHQAIKANENGKKEQGDADRPETQMKL